MPMTTFITEDFWKLLERDVQHKNNLYHVKEHLKINNFGKFEWHTCKIRKDIRDLN